MLAAAAATRTRSDVALTPDEQAAFDTVEKQCRDALTPEAFTRAWNVGAARDANAAADWALQLWTQRLAGASCASSVEREHRRRQNDHDESRCEHNHRIGEVHLLASQVGSHELRLDSSRSRGAPNS
jgi:hypothetical protein